MKFFWLGKRLFGGRFLRFMGGPKNETSLLLGNTINVCTHYQLVKILGHPSEKKENSENSQNSQFVSPIKGCYN